jgi:hypothetical protein
MDIVERLRHTEEETATIGQELVYLQVPVNPDGPEAADEIERLRELFKLERKDNIDVRHHLAKANDQIEQLRHEMERIADVSERWPDSLVSQINEIARAALKDDD